MLQCCATELMPGRKTIIITTLTHLVHFSLFQTATGTDWVGEERDEWVTCASLPFPNNFRYGLGQKTFWTMQNDLHGYTEPGQHCSRST